MSKHKSKIILSGTAVAVIALLIGFQNCSKKEDSTPPPSKKEQVIKNNECTDCNRDKVDVQSGTISGSITYLFHTLIPTAQAQAAATATDTTTALMDSDTDSDPSTSPANKPFTLDDCKSRCTTPTSCVDMFRIEGNALQLICSTNVAYDVADSSISYKFNIDHIERLMNKFIILKANILPFAGQPERVRYYAGIYNAQDQMANLTLDSSLESLFMEKHALDSDLFSLTPDDQSLSYAALQIINNAERWKTYFKVRSLFYDLTTGFEKTLSALFETSRDTIRNRLIGDLYSTLFADINIVDPSVLSEDPTPNEAAMAEIAARNPLPDSFNLYRTEFLGSLDSDGDGAQDSLDCAPQDRSKWRKVAFTLNEPSHSCGNFCVGAASDDASFISSHSSLVTGTCSDPTAKMTSCVIANNDPKVRLMDGSTPPEGDLFFVKNNEYIKYYRYRYPIVSKSYLLRETDYVFFKKTCVNGTLDAVATPATADTPNWPYASMQVLNTDQFKPRYYPIDPANNYAHFIQNPAGWVNQVDTENSHLIKTRQVDNKAASVTGACKSENFTNGTCWHDIEYYTVQVGTSEVKKVITLHQWEVANGIQDRYLGTSDNRLYFLTTTAIPTSVDPTTFAAANGYFSYELKQYHLPTGTLSTLATYAKLNTSSDKLFPYADKGGLVLLYFSDTNKKVVKYFTKITATNTLAAEAAVPDAKVALISRFLRGFKNGQIDFIRMTNPVDTRINILESYDVTKSTVIKSFIPTYPAASDSSFAAKEAEYYNLNLYKFYNFDNGKSLILTKSNKEPFTETLYAFDRNADSATTKVLESKVTMDHIPGKLFFTDAGPISIKNDDTMYSVAISADNKIQFLPVAKIAGLFALTQKRGVQSSNPAYQLKMTKSNSSLTNGTFFFVGDTCIPASPCEIAQRNKEKLFQFVIPVPTTPVTESSTPPTISLKIVGDINPNDSDRIESIWRTGTNYFLLNARGATGSTVHRLYRISYSP